MRILSLPGSGTSGVYGPDYLVAEDVVLVTVNYRWECFLETIIQEEGGDMRYKEIVFSRLGPLGFLSLGNDTIFGNQVKFLSWIIILDPHFTHQNHQHQQYQQHQQHQQHREFVIEFLRRCGT